MILGTVLLLTALTSFAPRRMMPVRSASRPTSKPLTSWMNRIGTWRLIALEHEPRGLVGAVGIDHAAELDGPAALGAKPQPLARHDPQRVSAEMPKAADKRPAVLGAILVEPAAVQNRREQLADVVLGRRIRAHQRCKDRRRPAGGSIVARSNAL